MGSSYDDWTVKELKEALKERGLPVSGNKHELIERLKSSEGLEGSPEENTEFGLFIAGGVGSFQPKKIVLKDIEQFENNWLHYKIQER